MEMLSIVGIGYFTLAVLYQPVICAIESSVNAYEVREHGLNKPYPDGRQ
jgi:hypothetical protein